MAARWRRTDVNHLALFFGTLHGGRKLWLVHLRICASNRVSRRENGGKERFTFGSKRGQTFRQVARDDPSYHLRCVETGYIPNLDQMDGYREYFSRHRDHNATLAAWGEREAIGLEIGICPVDYFGQYDSDWNIRTKKSNMALETNWSTAANSRNWDIEVPFLLYNASILKYITLALVLELASYSYTLWCTEIETYISTIYNNYLNLSQWKAEVPLLS